MSELSDEIESFLSDKRKEGRPGTTLYKIVAQRFLENLGYNDYWKHVAEYFEGHGIAHELGKLIPALEVTGADIADSTAANMPRIPDPEEAKKLLQTAVLGMPLAQVANGKTVVVSFGVAEPSTTRVQTKILAIDRRDDPLWQTDIAGTDRLVRKLISGADFLTGEQEVSKVVNEVKKAGKAVLTSGFLQMTITKPGNFEKMSPIKTSYKYQIQVTAVP